MPIPLPGWHSDNPDWSGTRSTMLQSGRCNSGGQVANIRLACCTAAAVISCEVPSTVSLDFVTVYIHTYAQKLIVLILGAGVLLLLFLVR